MLGRMSLDEDPCYFISIASRMVGVHAQTLRYYERVGLMMPSRSVGRQRLYSNRDIQKLRRIKVLTEDMGVNLAGVEVVLNLMDRLAEVEGEVGRLTQELQRIRASINDPTRRQRG